MTLEEREHQRALVRAGIKAAITEALEEHRRAGRKIAIWKDGRVVVVTVDEALAASPPSP